MKIILAKNAGFCFGVARAVVTINALIAKTDKKIYTLGPVIHNKQVVEDLYSKGVIPIDDISTRLEPGYVVIRAHGVSPEEYEHIKEAGHEIIDVTCPYVSKIQSLVREKHEEGYQIVIIGDKDHPEVIAINGWCGNAAVIVNDLEDINNIPLNVEKLCVVAQTTTVYEKWRDITEHIDKLHNRVVKFDTICNATTTRQEEGSEIASLVDMMVVIGGSGSSNTQKLYEVCRGKCPNTIKIETADELPEIDMTKIKSIGITAGTSTPGRIIKEVVDKMEELKNAENENATENEKVNETGNVTGNEMSNESEMSFEEALQESLLPLRSGTAVKGTIARFDDTEIFVNLNFKYEGVIPVAEYSSDKTFNPATDIKVGEEIEVFVLRVNEKDGIVNLSKKVIEEKDNWEYLKQAKRDRTPVEAQITSLTNGGVNALAKGIRIFIPASQMSSRFTKDLTPFVGTKAMVRIIETDQKKKKVVASRRVILDEEKTKNESAIWEAIEEGKEYEGIVSGLTDFGAFVDIGGVDGLVHITELSWKKIKHPSEVVTKGDKLTVKILDFDKEKKRVSLGYKKIEDNPWNKVGEKFRAEDIIKGKVVRILPFGAFVEIENGLDGLVHISQISNKRLTKVEEVLKIGQEIEAKIIEVDEGNMRISLSIKAVNPIDPPEKQEEKKPERKKPEEKKIVPEKEEKKEKEEENKEENEAEKKIEAVGSEPVAIKPVKKEAPVVEKEKKAKEPVEKIPNFHKEELSNKIGDFLGDLDLSEFNAKENKNDKK